MNSEITSKRNNNKNYDLDDINKEYILSLFKSIEVGKNKL